ncbi:hypothetical protein FA95DRAFT_1533071 [Auriscalpium vulgare]|uniref:Uncharacterized protein n=1 Tax=Auriscalpium vulgare TaxID=40419 RepID=A0ACB8S809_9AGAM|nr:hypothetical protein FA95DRAFT_1533071 [Auriscalpium vulgare]
MHTDDDVHGLSYPPDFLAALPVLLPRPAPNTPIRALSASQFADIHNAYTVAHAPDGVLFPFLHGLEGDNDAQNSFFAAGRGARVQPPHFRGLIWVCEDGDDDGPAGTDIEDEDDPEFEEGESDADDTFAMDVDMDVDADVHMHPVAHRAPVPPIYTTATARDRTPSTSSSSSISSSLDSPATPSTPATSLASPEPSCLPLALEHSHTVHAPLLTSTFKPRELLQYTAGGTAQFIPPRVPDGISLRNFGIQVVSAPFSHSSCPHSIPLTLSPIYATLSDIVVYSRKGATRSAFALAERFKQAIEAKREQRGGAGVAYNVFVLRASAADMRRDMPQLLARYQDEPVHGDGGAGLPHGGGAHTDGTDAHVARESPAPARVLKANTVNFAQREKEEMRDLTRASEILSYIPPSALSLSSMPDVSDTVRPWTAEYGQIFLGNANDVPLPPPADTHIPADPLSSAYNSPLDGFGYDVCIECHDRAPAPSAVHLRAAEEHLIDLERMWTRRGGSGPRPPPHAAAVVHLPFPSSPPVTSAQLTSIVQFIEFVERVVRPAPASGLGSRRVGSGMRPAKVLIHSADGYTESSVLALSLLMSIRGFTLPEAYLELQVAKKRSFFVYQTDVGLLKRVEGRLVRDQRGSQPAVHTVGHTIGAAAFFAQHAASIPIPTKSAHSMALSASYEEPPAMVPSQVAPGRRPRASTSPLLPSLADDHQVWFDDPRFDGSFPSRVLPFLYLGNLNHATNAYMLHALGITHVVSVGECALVPPTDSVASATFNASASCAFVPGKGPGRQGSLFIEEREGRIKVLDIKGVCDDGIDTLAPQLEPICDWIDKARAQGGRVLVHCRVGVSRSATVTIAYVMKHLALPLVDAYLIVRSRRLSVLIQPNMRLLYNLCGWEVKLARQRAGDDKDRLPGELARCLNWPYLAREVHLLNEKYLHN